MDRLVEELWCSLHDDYVQQLSQVCGTSSFGARRLTQA